MKALARLRTKFEDTMSAITFAEAGEFESARLILNKGEGRPDRFTKRVDKSVRPSLMTKRAGK